MNANRKVGKGISLFCCLKEAVKWNIKHIVYL